MASIMLYLAWPLPNPNHENICLDLPCLFIRLFVLDCSVSQGFILVSLWKQPSHSFSLTIVYNLSSPTAGYAFLSSLMWICTSAPYSQVHAWLCFWAFVLFLWSSPPFWCQLCTSQLLWLFSISFTYGRTNIFLFYSVQK